MMQYNNLPYPEFRDIDILEEKLHYAKYHNVTKFIIRPQLLEKINHYLHRGNQNFR